MLRPVVAIAVVAGCGGGGASGALATLRVGCPDDQFWAGTTCAPRAELGAKLAAGQDALARAEVELANAALDEIARAEPLDHETNISLWKQRGIAAAYGDDVATARSSFAMLLALDPGHFLSYGESPKATEVFELVRNELHATGAPAVEVNWAHGQRVGAPIPIDVSVVADPKQFLRTATLFVRTRGETGWRAADVALGAPGTERHVVLPPISMTRPTSLELYLRAYDDRGNEVLAWADPVRPREIPLRYDPPRPAWQRWWVITLAATAAVVGTGAIVYVATQTPPDRISGGLGDITSTR